MKMLYPSNFFSYPHEPSSFMFIAIHCFLCCDTKRYQCNILMRESEAGSEYRNKNEEEYVNYNNKYYNQVSIY